MQACLGHKLFNAEEIVLQGRFCSIALQERFPEEIVLQKYKCKHALVANSSVTRSSKNRTFCSKQKVHFWGTTQHCFFLKIICYLESVWKHWISLVDLLLGCFGSLVRRIFLGLCFSPDKRNLYVLLKTTCMYYIPSTCSLLIVKRLYCMVRLLPSCFCNLPWSCQGTHLSIYPDKDKYALRCPGTLFISDKHANFLFSVFRVVQGEAKTPTIIGCWRAIFAFLHALKIGTFRGQWTLEWVFKTSQFFPLFFFFLINSKLAFFFACLWTMPNGNCKKNLI